MRKQLKSCRYKSNDVIINVTKAVETIGITSAIPSSA
jgi:hypothetical protein